MIQLTRLDLGVNAVLVQLGLNIGQILRHLFIALFHRQLEVEDGLPAPAVDQPLRHQRRHFRWLFHHIADHPRDVVAVRTIAETVFTQPGHLAGIHQALGHRAVIDRRDPHVALHQLIGPAARAGAEIDGIHAVRQTLVPLVRRNKNVERLFQLEGGAARRVGRKLQPRNAHIERRVIVTVRVAGIAAARGDKEHMHHRTLRRFIAGQDARFAQRRAQRHGKLAAELHQLFAFVGVRHLDAQIAALLHHALQHADDRRNAILRRQVAQQFAHHKHLAGEDQRAERQIAHQLLAIILLIAFKNHIARVFFDPGKTKHLEAGCLIGNFCCALFLKPRATIEDNLIHEQRPYVSDELHQLTLTPSRRGSSRRPPGSRTPTGVNERAPGSRGCR